MQPVLYQNMINLRFGLPINLSLPKLNLAKIIMDILKMSGVVLFAALATLLMGL